MGDYKFDNTNYAGGGFVRVALRLCALSAGERLRVLRRYLWLMTDGAYKSAVEAHLAQAGGLAEHGSPASSSTISPTPSR